MIPENNVTLITSQAIEKNLSCFALLPSLGFIRVSGIDRAAFLQGQLTCDVLLLTENNSACLGAHCNTQGRIHSLFHVVYTPEAFYLVTPKVLVEESLKNLKKYALRLKVEFSIPENGLVLAVADEKALKSRDYYCPTPASFCAYALGTSTDLMVLTASLANSLQNVGEIDFHRLEIAAKIPRLNPKTIDVFTPHDIGLPALGGVSFKKGCYIGQEIIARMEYRGHIKKGAHLAQINAENALPGETISDDAGEPIGKIIDSEKLNSTTNLAIILKRSSG